MNMISDRIKKLTDRINAAAGPVGSLYIVKYLDGVYSCKRPEMTWNNDNSFADWENSLRGHNTIIIDDIEDAIKHPDQYPINSGERRAKKK
jgi:hypothetical protein